MPFTFNPFSGNFDNTPSTDKGDTAYTSLISNSANFSTYNYVNSNFLALSGGIVTGNTQLNANLTVYGNISATGSSFFANTFYSTTSALSVINIGNTGPALYVGNNGTGDIASFYDIDQNIEVFHIAGSNGSFPNVGVKTSSPNVDFTVNGQISSSGTIFTTGGTSNNWNSVYSVVNSNSASTWNYQGTDIKNLSSGWVGGNNAFTTVNSNSAIWNTILNGTSQIIIAAVYNAENTSLSRGQIVYSFGSNGSMMSVKLASNSSESTSSKTLGFVNNTIFPNATGYVTIAGSMDQLNLGSPFIAGDPLWLDSTPGSYTRVKPTAPNHLVYLGVVERANSGNGTAYVKVQNGYEIEELHNVLITSPTSGQILRLNSNLWQNVNDAFYWDSTFTTVQTNSATTWNYQGTDIKALSAGWVGGNSAFTTVQTNSATTWNYQGTDIKAISAGWVGGNSAFTTVNSNSANWNSNYSLVQSKSASWDSAFSNSGADLLVRTLTGGWVGGNSAFTTVQTNSATTWNYQGTDIKAISAGWVGGNSAFTTVNSNSANWNSVYSNVQTNSSNYILNGGNTKSSNITIGTNDAFNLNFETNNIPRMTIDTSGNIGIGVNVLSSKLDIQSNITNQPVLFLKSPNGTFGNRSILGFWSTFAFAPNNDVDIRRSADIVSGFSSNNWGNEYISFNVGNNGSPNDSYNLTLEKMRIDGSGNVGIGTTTPNEKLSIVGNISANGIITANTGNSNQWNSSFTTVNSNSASWNSAFGNSGADLLVRSLTSGWVGGNSAFTTLRSNSANYILDGGNTKGSNLLLGTNDNFNLTLETNNTPRMIVLNSGNVGIGTTTPNERLTVSGNISAVGNHVFDSNSASPAVRITQTGTGDALVVEDSENPDSTRFTITSGGQVFIGTISTNYQTSSKLTIVSDEFIGGIRFDSYNDLNVNSHRNNRARGTLASPSAVKIDDRLASFLGGGFGTTKFNSQNAGLCIFAAENFTDTNAGSYITLGTSLTGTNSGSGGSERMRITHDGKVGIGTITPNQTLTVFGNISASGFIYGNGSNLTGITAGGGGGSTIDVGVRSLTANWTTDITNLTVTTTFTIPNPTGTFTDGKRLLYRVTQGGTGNNAVSLGNKFKIPSTSVSPLPFSTTLSSTDLLGVMYNQPFDRWDVISLFPDTKYK